MRSRFLVVLLICSWNFSGQTTPTKEHQVEAVFLFNFTQFIEWPSNAFSEPQTPLIIGVLGKNPFGNYLNEAVLNEKADNHPLIVQYYNTAEEISSCHILFINLNETKTKEVIGNLKGKSTLTVSNAGSFLKQGGMIRFFTRNDKINDLIQKYADTKKADESYSYYQYGNFICYMCLLLCLRILLLQKVHHAGTFYTRANNFRE